MTPEYADANRSREESSCMLADATTGEAPFDYSVVHKMDRFPRSLEESVLCRDRLSTSGVRIVSEYGEKHSRLGCRSTQAAYGAKTVPLLLNQYHGGMCISGS